MMRCDKCKFWDNDDREQKRVGNLIVRRCTKPLQWWDITEWTDEPDPEKEWHNLRRVLPEAEGVKMFTQDGSDYRADLLTASDFFCAHFESVSQTEAEMPTVEQRLEIATAVLRNISGPIRATCLDIPGILKRLDALAAGAGDVADEAFGIAAELREIFAKLDGKDRLVSAGLDIAQGGETDPQVVIDMLTPSYLR